MIITNGKIIVSSENDYDSLKNFFTELVNTHNEARGASLVPEEYLEEGSEFTYYEIPKGIELTEVLEFGANLTGIYADDIIEKPGKTLVEYKHVFTSDEQLENGDTMARCTIEIAELEGKKKEQMANYSAKIEEQKAIMAKYAGFINTGYDMKDTEAKVVLDFGSGKRHYKSIQTGKIIKSEPLRSEDRQIEIQFEQIDVPKEGEEQANEGAEA